MTTCSIGTVYGSNGPLRCIATMHTPGWRLAPSVCIPEHIAAPAASLVPPFGVPSAAAARNPYRRRRNSDRCAPPFAAPSALPRHPTQKRCGGRRLTLSRPGAPRTASLSSAASAGPFGDRRRSAARRRTPHPSAAHVARRSAFGVSSSCVSASAPGVRGSSAFGSVPVRPLARLRPCSRPSPALRGGGLPPPPCRLPGSAPLRRASNHTPLLY